MPFYQLFLLNLFLFPVNLPHNIYLSFGQAKEAEGADNAVMLLTHLSTFIMALQDERVRTKTQFLLIIELELNTFSTGSRRSWRRAFK